tara:strand:+ start:442 stop:2274 length:1833 start_codon:yes stop_codon:yes gene_type:complete
VTTYKELTGVLIKRQTTNPDDPLDGQVWYNNTTGNLSGLAISEAWASSGTLPGNRTYGGGGGSQTAALAFGGALNPPGAAQAGTFEYNGSGWSSGGDLPQVADLCGGLGTQTAGLKTFGRIGPPPTTATTEAYEYNGSTWSAEGNGSNARWGVGSAGTQTAGIAFGGFYNPPYTWFNNTEKYNGSAWTNSGTLSTARSQVGFLGDSETSALCIGGETPPSFGTTNAVEGYNGSTWSAETNYPASSQGSAGVGSEADGLVFAPSPNSTNAFKYDGTTFTAAPSLGNGRQNGTRAGTTSAALAFQGNAGSGQNFTEEFTRSTNVVTGAAWGSGGNLNTARSGHAMATNSPADTGLCFGGNYPSGTDNSEEYNGSTWSEGSNLPQALSFLGGAGTQTAGLSFTGRQNPGSRVNNTYEYNGTSWTESPGTYGAAQAYTGGAGTQTAALGVAGETPPGTDLTTSYEYNGSTWTAGNACNVAGYDALVFGTSAGAHMACLTGPPTGLETEAYDGNNWTASATALQTQAQGGASGTYPIGLIFGGSSSGPSTSTQGWDGTAWSTRPALSTGRRAKGSGVTALGLAAGGETPASPTSNATEEFTPETSAANIAKFTTS